MLYNINVFKNYSDFLFIIQYLVIGISNYFWRNQ